MLRYAAFKVERNGTRTLIGEGTREYVPETDIKASDLGGTSFRRLLLFEPFELELRFSRGRPLDGFGLVINRRKSLPGFSFNWFESDKGDIFVKANPKQSGRVRVEVVRTGRSADVRAIEFLDDIVLRFADGASNPSADHTHEIVIAQGSILRIIGAAP